MRHRAEIDKALLAHCAQFSVRRYGPYLRMIGLFLQPSWAEKKGFRSNETLRVASNEIFLDRRA